MLELVVIRWLCLLRTVLIAHHHRPYETNLQLIETVLLSWPHKLSFTSAVLETKFHGFLTFNRYRTKHSETFVKTFLAHHGVDKVAHFREVVLSLRSISVRSGQFFKSYYIQQYTSNINRF